MDVEHVLEGAPSAGGSEVGGKGGEAGGNSFVGGEGSVDGLDGVVVTSEQGVLSLLPIFPTLLLL